MDMNWNLSSSSVPLNSWEERSSCSLTAGARREGRQRETRGAR